MADLKSWKNVELKGNAIKKFKEFLREMKIMYETSAAGFGYIHFEVLVNEEEQKKANEFLCGVSE